MTMIKKVLVIASAAVVLVIAALAAASPDIPDKSPEMLKEAATHIAVGEVLRIYEVEEKEPKWKYTRYLAEVQVESLEKGEGASAKELIYVRWFKRRYRGGMPPLSSNGHKGWVPEKGDRARVYLARNAHDGFTTDNSDGGFNVLVPNGFEELPAKK